MIHRQQDSSRVPGGICSQVIPSISVTWMQLAPAWNPAGGFQLMQTYISSRHVYTKWWQGRSAFHLAQLQQHRGTIVSSCADLRATLPLAIPANTQKGHAAWNQT